MLSIDVYSTRAVIRSQEPLTVGLVGGRVQFRFSDQWKSLVKTAVFRQGTVTRDIMGISHQAVIPWEVLQQPGLPVQIGVYGSDSNGKVVIPTVWAVTDPVAEGADPAADVTLPPTLEVTQQLQSQIGSLDQLNTAAKDSLVKAINEANRGCFTVSTNADGTVNRTMPAIQDAYLAGKSVVLFDGGYVAALEGIAKVDAEKTGAENFIYTFRCHDENGVQRVYEVYYKDSRSVFRQYDTKIRAVWRVGVEKKDGVYQANRTVTEMTTAYQDGKNLVCWLGGRELYLIGTDKDGNSLNRFHFGGGSADGSLVQRVTVYAANGSADNMAQASVYSDLPCVDLSGYAMLGKVGIIGDSLSVGVEDHSASESIQNTDHSWGAYLSRTAGNPSLFLGASGASSATFINDGLLDGALKEENRCDAYIVGLGFNDLRNGATVGSIQDVTDSDTYTDTNHNATPYGSYYYNIGKILRKLHAFNPDAPIFVLTNPEYISINAELFNQPLRNICAEYGTEYNAHLIDLRGIYGPIFENLEAVRGPRNHFDRQTYAYMGQIIGTAITRDIRKNPDAYPQLKGYLPDEADPSLPARFTVRVDTDTAVNRSVDEMTAAYQAGQSLVLYDNGYVAALEGIGRDDDNKYIYTFRCHDKDGTQKVYTVSSPNVLEKSTVEAGGGSGECVYYVNITPLGETSATSDRTFNEITEAHNNGLIVKCKFDTYVLPLCFITNSQVIFCGATSNLTVFVTQYSNDIVEHSVAELAIEADVPTKDEFKSLADKVESLPSGDPSNRNTELIYETIVEESINIIEIKEDLSKYEYVYARVNSDVNLTNEFRFGLYDVHGEPSYITHNTNVKIYNTGVFAFKIVSSSMIYFLGYWTSFRPNYGVVDGEKFVNNSLINIDLPLTGLRLYRQNGFQVGETIQVYGVPIGG